MARAERNVSRAHASALDQRDHHILLSLLEHKVLTTDQLRSLFFRSLRRCQHRLRELKDLGVIASFTPRRGFAEGRPPACWFLTKTGLEVVAAAKGVRASDLSWIPDEGYRTSRNLAHRLGVNAFACALAEASRDLTGHCLHTWRSERWVRTPTVDVKPDGFGRYLHPDGACEFYLEYDRGTEAVGALSGKFEGYLRLAAGWTRERDLTGFPNLLVVVPEAEREYQVATAHRNAAASVHVGSSFPLYVASEDRLTPGGVLGSVWRHVPTGSEHLSLLDLPASPRNLYRATRCLGRYFIDADPGHRRRIALHPLLLGSAPGRPDMHLETSAPGGAKRGRPPSVMSQRGRG
jgi:hypothetical protein